MRDLADRALAVDPGSVVWAVWTRRGERFENVPVAPVPFDEDVNLGVSR